jgi:hypothetical protein
MRNLARMQAGLNFYMNAELSSAKLMTAECTAEGGPDFEWSD